MSYYHCPKKVSKVMSGIFHGHPILQLHRSESSFVLDSKVSTDVQCEKGTNYSYSPSCGMSSLPVYVQIGSTGQQQYQFAKSNCGNGGMAVGCSFYSSLRLSLLQRC